jgi:hypothetical protein
LKINYRTSEQIRIYSHGVLKGIEIDDLNGGSALDALAGQLSTISTSYCKSLDSIKEQVEKRKEDIYLHLSKLICLNRLKML